MPNDKFHLECAQENIQTADRYLWHAPNLWKLAAVSAMGACIGAIGLMGMFLTSSLLFLFLVFPGFLLHGVAAQRIWEVIDRIAECRKELGYARERLNKITKERLE